MDIMNGILIIGILLLVVVIVLSLTLEVINGK